MVGIDTARAVMVGIVGGPEGMDKGFIHALPWTSSGTEDNRFGATFTFYSLELFSNVIICSGPTDFLPTTGTSCTFTDERLLGSFLVSNQGRTG
jgi:hypothetical protein